jgi:hypothetical protein
MPAVNDEHAQGTPSNSTLTRGLAVMRLARVA